MEEKLLELEKTMDSVMSCNLDDKSKKIILNVLKKEIFELRQDMSIINKNIETYRGK